MPNSLVKIRTTLTDRTHRKLAVFAAEHGVKRDDVYYLALTLVTINSAMQREFEEELDKWAKATAKARAKTRNEHASATVS